MVVLDMLIPWDHPPLPAEQVVANGLDGDRIRVRKVCKVGASERLVRHRYLAIQGRLVTTPTEIYVLAKSLMPLWPYLLWEYCPECPRLEETNPFADMDEGL